VRIGFILLGACLATGLSACSRECKSGEAKSGDNCIVLRDASAEGNAAGDRDSAGEDVEPEDVSADAGQEEGDSGILEDSGAAASTGDAAVDAVPGLSPMDGSQNPPAAERDGGVAEAGSPTSRCQPNPCGHGTCTATPQSLTCGCEPGWVGDGGLCNVNTNPALSGLAVSAGRLFPAFRRDLYEYSVDLSLGDSEIVLTPTVAVPDGVALQIDGRPHQSGTPTSAYAVSINRPVTMSLQAAATSGAMHTYRVTVRRTLALQATLRSNLADATTFGTALAMSGGMLMATSKTPSQDEVSLFTRFGRTWTWIRTIEWSPQVEKRLGSAMAMNDKWLVIGAPGSGTTFPGEVYCYRRSEVGLQRPPIILSVAGESYFGTTVAIDGDLLAVVTARLHIFDLSTADVSRVSITPPYGGDSVDIEGDLLVVSGPRRGTEDSTYAFRRGATGWLLSGPLRDSPRVYGGRVSISNGEVHVADTYIFASPFVGAPQPILHSFIFDGNSWLGSNVALPAFPAVSATVDPNAFGFTPIASDDRVVIVSAGVEGSKRFGIHRASDPFVPAVASERPTDGLGLVYVFVKARSGWRLEAFLGPPQASVADAQMQGFGVGVAYDSGLIAISANTTVGGAAGAVYVYGPDCSQVPAGAQVPGC
jgi:hypothetical protein